MRKSLLMGSASLLAVATPAAAQTTPPRSVADTETRDDIIVTGVRASLEKAISLKRDADNHVEVISAADIGKLPDKNVADALQRLPGVHTSSAGSGEGGFDENDRVSIRGTSPSLTQTIRAASSSRASTSSAACAATVRRRSAIRRSARATRPGRRFRPWSACRRRR